MPHVCKKLKLNKFRQVSLPSNKDLFMRVGKRQLPEMQDGQVADFNTDTMSSLTSLEAQYLKDSQMPLDTK